MLAAAAISIAVGLDAGEWRAILAFLFFMVVVLGLGLWGVHKTSGRSYRDMVLLLLAGVVLIGLMVPAIVYFREPLDSPDPRTRQLTKFVFQWGFAAIAILVCWGFNRLVRARRRHKSTRKNPAFDNHPPEGPR
jgi:hypothetical protein